VYRLLVKRGPDGFTPTDIAEKLDVPAPTLSFHLKELQRAGLLKVRREGRCLFYSPDFGSMNELIGFLNDNCCSLADDNCGPPTCATPAKVRATHSKRRQA
jgi:DNA-binding transcriptional ArsR family regulator